MLCVSMQVSQGMVGQGAARRAAGIILEMVKVCVYMRAIMYILDHHLLPHTTKNFLCFAKFLIYTDDFIYFSCIYDLSQSQINILCAQ